MNRHLIAAILAALALAGPARAEDKPAATARDSVLTFFRHLKETLAQSAVQGERKKNRTGSVAAVRGKDQSSPLADPNEPVIIGDVRSRKDKAEAAEDAEVAKGVDLVLAGKIDDGVKSLEAFKASHPKSHNLEKVQQAIDQAKALAAAPADAPKADADKK